jgi:hypothetical protein
LSLPQMIFPWNDLKFLWLMFWHKTNLWAWYPMSWNLRCSLCSQSWNSIKMSFSIKDSVVSFLENDIIYTILIIGS